MAKASTSRPWEPDFNEQCQSLVCDDEYLHDLMYDHILVLTKSLELTPKFWDLLFMRKVLDEDMMKEIQAEKTKKSEVLVLFHHLIKSKVFQLHGFLWALVNSGQYEIVQQLQFPLQLYFDMETFLRSSTFRCPACLDAYKKAYILTGCGHYICGPCAKAADFSPTGNQQGDLTCPVPDCSKITQTCTTNGDLGLDEDVAFKDICVQLEKAVDIQTAEGVDTENSALEALNTQKAEIKEKVEGYQNHKGAIEQHGVLMKDYVDKIKQAVDEWAEENLEHYAGMHYQVEKKLKQSIKWEKATKDLAAILTARPRLNHSFEGVDLDLCPTADILMAKLGTGAPIKNLMSPLPYSLPIIAKQVYQWTLPAMDYHPSVSWNSAGQVMLTSTDGVWFVELDPTFTSCKASLPHVTTTRPGGLCVASDGTWFLCLPDAGIIEVHDPRREEVQQWRPEGVAKPVRVTINETSIFVLGSMATSVQHYDRDLRFVEEYPLGTGYVSKPYDGYLHVTENGILVVTSTSNGKYALINLHTKEVKFQGQTGAESGQFSNPMSPCTLSNGEYITICDLNNMRICVLNSEGDFIGYMKFDKVLGYPRTMSVLPRAGQTTLMVVVTGTWSGSPWLMTVYALEY